MRAVVQRVTSASVVVEERTVGAIDEGLLILLGVSREDTSKDVAYTAEKIANLRIFEDDTGKMNQSLLNMGGSALVVSQFTLYGDVRKGRRPSFDGAAPPAMANALYEEFVEAMKDLGLTVATGIFQADMKVSLTNDGPVTIIVDSQKVV